MVYSNLQKKIKEMHNIHEKSVVLFVPCCGTMSCLFLITVGRFLLKYPVPKTSPPEAPTCPNGAASRVFKAATGTQSVHAAPGFPDFWRICFRDDDRSNACQFATCKGL